MATSAAMLVSCGSSEDPNEGDTKTVKVGDAKIELVYVAPGNFRMGATAEQEGFDSFTELPAHDVQITKGYWIAKTEVTQELWDEVMDTLVGENVRIDTSFSTTATGLDGMLDEEKFVGMVRAFGAERILFGTDSPWASQRKSLKWIEHTPLHRAEKEKILGKNAEELLKLKKR